MLIDLKSIPIGGLYLRGEESPDSIEIDDTDVGFHLPIRYDIKASLTKRTLLVRGRLEVEVQLTCSRCLKEFDEKIEIEDFNIRKEIDNPGETIDLTEDVRADIILSLPRKPLCKMDCPGICPSCGQDLNEGTCGCSVARSDSPFADLNIDR
jgi:DUF177 domain-containing protein